MLRDVLVASLNKGQFLLALVGLIIIIIVARLPPEDLHAVIISVVDKLNAGDLLGWILFVCVSVAWAILSHRTRRIHENEIKRIGKEKSDLQKSLLGSGATSSRT